MEMLGSLPAGTHPLWIVGIALSLAMLPILVGTLTSYLKVSIVLSLIRNAIGAGQIPGAVVVMTTSFAISIYVMAPVISETAALAGSVELKRLISTPSMESLQELAPVAEPWLKFLRRHAGEREIRALSAELGKARVSEQDKGRDKDQDKENSQKQEGATQEVPVSVLLTAFVITELKEAFAMGFVLLLPFLAIDLIVANILAGMGMYMLSPAMLALPLKLILFVVSDAWILLSKGLINSYAL